MQQGDNPGFLNEIIEEGFKIEREFKILDLQLTNDNSKLDRNLDTLVEKLTSLSTFWDEMGLILFQGDLWCSKLTMCLTLGMFAASYYFGIFDTIAHRFVSGKVGIPFEQAFRDKKYGGLSLMTSKKYTKALRGLFRRAISSEDTWAIAIKHLKRPK